MQATKLSFILSLIVLGIGLTTQNKSVQAADDPAKAGGKELRVLLGHQDRVNSVAFSPDGKTLASPDGKLLATGSFDKSIRLWELASITTKDRE